MADIHESSFGQPSPERQWLPQSRDPERLTADLAGAEPLSFGLSPSLKPARTPLRRRFKIWRVSRFHKGLWRSYQDRQRLAAQIHATPTIPPQQQRHN